MPFKPIRVLAMPSCITPLPANSLFMGCEITFRQNSDSTEVQFGKLPFESDACDRQRQWPPH